MARLGDILVRDIHRTIDGVIKADDKTHILQEVDEYVLTNEIQKYLDKVMRGYRDSIERSQTNSPYPWNGVWISGYFGSGKSHLLKILSYILDNQTVDGESLLKKFLPKVRDDIVRGDFEQAARIPSVSILFNIDQQADAAKSKDENALLFIFEKVFNRMRGFLEDDPVIANFEEDLSKKERYEEFKAFYQQRNGVSWVEDRSDVMLLEQDRFAETWMEFDGCSREEAGRLLERYENSYSLSVEGFAKRVKSWLDAQDDSRFRLNFFIDEVGQFITGYPRLTLNLQTIAESLGTICQGRVWIFVTSQESLNTVVGDSNTEQSYDFSKIRDRFHFRIPLSSADVKEVIQRRLLEKNEEGREKLGELFMHERESFKTLFSFQQGVKELHFKGKEDFILSYPFQAYQYHLLQQALKGLSEHNAFMGRHVSRGERSMLEIFQDVGRDIESKELFTWAAFDQMFAGIRNTLQSSLLNAINLAERNIDKQMAVRLLKILLLVKYIKDFTATVDHLSVLLLSNMDQDLAKLKEEVREALNLLERQSYIERHGEEYEYLTNEEKDVEEEIKNAHVDIDEMRKFFDDVIFGSVIKGSKIRYGENGQDYPFRKLIDGESMKSGTHADISINIISPFHPNTGDKNTILQQSVGKKEMLVFLVTEPRFAGDLTLYFKTQNYIQKKQGHVSNATRKRIISDKQNRNYERRDQLTREMRDALETAEIYAFDSKLDIGKKSPKDRIEEAFQLFIQTAYPYLGMLKNTYSEDQLSKILFPSDADALDGSGGLAMQEDEKELYNYIVRVDAGNEKVVLSSLMYEFQGGQHGWYPFAILCLVAKLYMRDAIEIFIGTKPQDTARVYDILRKNRDLEQVVIKPAAQFRDEEVEALKRFYKEFFLFNSTKEKGKEVAIEFKKSLNNELENVQTYLAQKVQYPFLEKLEPYYSQLNELVHKNEYSYFLKNREEFEEDLLFGKEEIYNPIEKFFKAQQNELWKNLRDYLKTHEPNLSELNMQSEVQKAWDLLDSEEPYKQSRVKKAKDIVEAIKEKENEQLPIVIKKAKATVDKYLADLKEIEEFDKLSQGDKQEIIKPFELLRDNEIEQHSIFPVIRDKAVEKGERLFEEARDRIHTKTNPEKKILYASASEKKVNFSKPELVSEEDVNAYAEQLRKQYKNLIKAGKRIGLS
ncbi:MAG: BREX system P-loop protein BrxC [Spirochaetia bacterium]|nr:BREX system P-loop protein BrxC [Spirochaetia bacterium]